MRRLLGDDRGGSIVEFAFLAPIFLMMVFLVLDGGRMLFTKQALNELAANAARCAALHPAECADTASVRTYTLDRGLRKSRLASAAMTVRPTMSTGCNGVATGMARVQIDFQYPKGVLGFLPQAAVPDTLTSVGCYPKTS